MTGVTPPLSPHSEVVDERRRWMPDWYSWFSDLSGRLRTGEATFSSGTTVNVTLAPPEPRSDYVISIESPENKTFWITDKTISGFTINASASSSATVRWALNR